MNIFVLDKDPIVAAQMLCDKHIPRMIYESAQMLNDAFPSYCKIENGQIQYYRFTKKKLQKEKNAESFIKLSPYNIFNANHICTKWARKSRENFVWLVKHGLEMADEHLRRYKTKMHSSVDVIRWCYLNMDFLSFPTSGLTPFALATENFSGYDAVDIYRKFYVSKISYMNLKWERGRAKPEWLDDYLSDYLLSNKKCNLV